MRFRKAFFAIGLFLGIVSISFSLEPRLLWKMELKKTVWDVAFANITGDLILISGGVLTLVNKDGKVLWQWGPDLEKVLFAASISDDGKYIAFGTSLKMEVRLKRGYYEDHIHYCERNGKEIWKTDSFLLPWLSPSGKHLFLGVPGGWEGPSLLLDSKGKELWRKDIGIVEKVIFSPDGNYFFIYPGSILFDIQKKDFLTFPSMEITSISENGEYIGLEGKENKEGIYDKNGNLTFKGKNTISGNGRIVVRDGGERIEIFNFPEKTKIISYPIRKVKREIPISYDGRIVVVCGKKTDKESPSNLFILNVSERTLWEGTIPEVQRAWVFLTRDGKYLLIVKERTIYYFQIF